MKDWMRDTDITRLFYDVLDRSLPTAVLPEGTLLDGVGPEKLKEIEDKIMAELEAVPILYTAITYLPRFKPLGIPSVEIARGVRLIQRENYDAAQLLRVIYPDAENQFSVASANTTAAELACVFLTVERSGYYAPRNATADKLVADIKRVFGLGVAAQIFDPDNLGRRTDAGFTSSSEPVQGVAEDCKMVVVDQRGNSIVDVRELPLGAARFTNYYEFYQNRWFPPRGLNVQRDNTVTTDQIHKLLRERLGAIKTCFENEGQYSDILAGSEWLFDSEGIHAYNETYAFLYAAIGLEAVMLSPKENITYTLGDRLAYLIAISREDRIKIKQRFDDFYNQRSQIVHGKAVRLNEEQGASIIWGQRMLRRALRRELELLEPARRSPHDPWP